MDITSRGDEDACSRISRPKDTIISSAPCSLDHLLRTRFEQKLSSKEPSKLEWIKLIDLLGRVYMFPVVECETFLKLKSVVAERLRAGSRVDLGCCGLFVRGRHLTASLWLILTSSEKSRTLTVSIHEIRGTGYHTLSLDPSTGLQMHQPFRPTGSTSSKFETKTVLPQINRTDMHTDISATHRGPKQNSNNNHDHYEQSNSGNSAAHPPDSDLETEEIVRKALSNIRPFLEWKMDRGSLWNGLPYPEMGEKKRPFFLLTLMRGKLMTPKSKSQSITDPDFAKYNEDQLYSETLPSTLQQLESEERNLRGQESSHECQRDQENTRNNGIDDITICTKHPDDRRRQVALRIAQFSMQLVLTFIPASEEHLLLVKVWGALNTLLTNTVPERKYRLLWLRAWAVQSHRDDDMWAEHQLPIPDFFRGCTSCNEGKAYESRSEAVDHILQTHYSTERSDVDVVALSSLVRRKEETWLGRRNGAQFILLGVVLERLESLLNQVQDLRTGLASSIGNTQPTYTLPNALVKTLRRILVFTLAAGITPALIDAECATWVPSQELSIPKVDCYITRVDQLGESAENSMAKAQEAMFAMIKAGISSSQMIYKSVGTRFMISTLLRSLLAKTIADEKPTVEFYSEFFKNLRSRVLSKRPRKLILGDITLLQEEVRAVISVRRAQHSVLHQLRKAIDPETYFVVDDAEDYQASLSLRVLNEALRATLTDRDDLFWIIKKLTDLEQKTRYRLEVLEEDHGKAIFIFTLVTVIFLPLSFVTSYMGMNTADIRDTKATQQEFWAIAAPVTAVVMGTAMFLAYEGDTAKDWLLSLKLSKKEKSLQTKSTHETGKHVPVDKKPSAGFNQSSEHSFEDSGQGLVQGSDTIV